MDKETLKAVAYSFNQWEEDYIPLKKTTPRVDKEFAIYYQKEAQRFESLTEEQQKSFRLSPFKRQFKQGRNESCPCGSGNKYKKCCLDNMR